MAPKNATAAKVSAPSTTAAEPAKQTRQRFQGTAKEKLIHRLGQIDELLASIERKCAAYRLPFDGRKSLAATLDAARKLPDDIEAPTVARGAAEEFAKGETAYVKPALLADFKDALGDDADKPFKVGGVSDIGVTLIAKSGTRVLVQARQITHAAPA